MGFRHDSGPHFGRWEMAGTVVRDAPSGLSRLYDFGGFQWWLPKRFVTEVILPAGKVAVLMPGWLYEQKMQVRRAELAEMRTHAAPDKPMTPERAMATAMADDVMRRRPYKE